MSEDEIDPEEMRDALSAIAQEMQKLHSESLSSSPSEVCEGEKLLSKLMKYKTTLCLRKVQLRKLRQNLKTACQIAKTISSAKATETAALSNHLTFARNQYLELVQDHNEKCEIINKIRAENETLHDQLEYFNHIIQLGYNELQKIRNERVENISILEQLKHIIVCCGQYYADHSNEHERCNRLEHRNRFLSNRILVMENHLQVALEELRNQKISLKHFKDKKDSLPQSRHCIGVVCSEFQIGPNESNIKNLTMTKIEVNNHSLQSNMRDLDLTSHLTTVKKLLHDQENLIKDLKSLSRIVITEEPYMQ